MGCTVREKHIRTTRRLRSSAKQDSDHLPKVSPFLPKPVFDSTTSPSAHPICFPNPNPNPNPDPHAPNFDHCAWGYCTEEQLEEILYKNIEFLFKDSVTKLVSLGYDGEVALKAVMRNGLCYAGIDVRNNILHNAVAFMNRNCGTPCGCTCGDHKNSAGAGAGAVDDEDSEIEFSDLSQLVEYSLAAMVCLLLQVRPRLNRGDAMWCLLMSDLHVGRASTVEIPSSQKKSMDGVSLGLCKFHSGWGFGGVSEFPVQAGKKEEIDLPKRFNLSPSMTALLKRNVSAFASGYKANWKQVKPEPVGSVDVSKCTGIGEEEKSLKSQDEVNSMLTKFRDMNLKSQEEVNSMLTKFRDMNLDENLEQVSDEQKDEILVTLASQVKEFERQLKERKEWAQQKAMQAAKKLSSDLAQLKLLRMEREETQKLKKGKQTLEDTTMKRLSEMENALRKASSQVDRANAAVRQLEVENAEIRAEMEASKLSASESLTTCLEIAKREKKYLKRLLNWEKQKAKLQGEIAAEKQKFCDLQQQLADINAAQKAAEAKLREEGAAKEQALSLVEEERRAKEETEVNNKRRLEALRLKMEIDFQRHRDDLQRLEQELLRLKSTAQSTTDQNDAPPPGKSRGGRPTQGAKVARLHREQHTEQDKNLSDKELNGDRKCLVCLKEEVSVVFLPCAHQVVCATCSSNYGKKSKSTCPCCQKLIERRIRVFGASS